MNGVFRRLGIALATAVLLTGCAGQQPDGAQVDTTPADFVGGAQCVDCHAAETALWQGSHHDLAMQPATEETVLADFDGTRFRGNGMDARFRRTEDGGFAVETEGADGTRATFQVQYTFGAIPLQQYLVAAPGGRLQALGAAWDTRPADEGGQRWFHLYPDEQVPPGDELHWTGPNMNWNYMCAECHSTDLQKNYDVDGDRFDTTWSDINVNCEACHGPGSNHVTWADAAERGEELAFPTAMGLEVDLSAGEKEWRINDDTGLATRVPELENNAQVEACGRCHSRRSSQADYEYGKPLTDTHRVALLEERLYFADGQIRDEVYVFGSFVQSRMYAKGVTCSDCHESHSGRVLVDGDGLCNQCHLAAKFAAFEHTRHKVGTVGASCVDCHMTERMYMVVDGRRDHSFRVPRPDLSDAVGSPNACTTCHTDQTNAWAAGLVEEWFPNSEKRGTHYGEAIAAGRGGVATAPASLRRLADDWERPAIARATSLSLLGRYPGPDTLESLARALNNSDPLIRAAALGAMRNYDPGSRARLAYPLLRDRDLSVRLQAARALASLPLNEIPEIERATILAGVEELIEALEVNAERAEFQLNLGVLYAETGRAEESEAAYRRAIAQNPRGIAARVNLADIYRAQNRDAEGQILLREALELQPENPDVHQALGLLLIRRGQRAEAAVALEQSWRLAPGNSGYGVAYALVLDAQGDLAGSTSVLREVVRRHPRDPQVLSTLVQASRKAGDSEAALGYARRLLDVLPGDRGVQQLVRELEASGQGG